MVRPSKGNGRYTPPKLKPPAHLVAAAKSQACPDCDSDVDLIYHNPTKTWNVQIAHDNGCVQLSYRQKHGATRSYAMVADPGRTLEAESVAEFADAVRQHTNPDVLRFTFDGNAAFDRSEREASEQI